MQAHKHAAYLWVDSGPAEHGWASQAAESSAVRGSSQAMYLRIACCKHDCRHLKSPESLPAAFT